MNHTEICTGTSAEPLKPHTVSNRQHRNEAISGLGLNFGNLTASDQQLESFKIIAPHNRTEVAIFCKEGENNCR